MVGARLLLAVRQHSTVLPVSVVKRAGVCSVRTCATRLHRRTRCLCVGCRAVWVCAALQGCALHCRGVRSYVQAVHMQCCCTSSCSLGDALHVSPMHPAAARRHSHSTCHCHCIHHTAGAAADLAPSFDTAHAGTCASMAARSLTSSSTPRTAPPALPWWATWLMRSVLTWCCSAARRCTARGWMQTCWQSLCPARCCCCREIRRIDTGTTHSGDRSCQCIGCVEFDRAAGQCCELRC
jgi:hypothetical protein